MMINCCREENKEIKRNKEWTKEKGKGCLQASVS